ncbi:hypothetical protein BC830DRAFT_1125055 [Chytriomyces sp. MP71]|nr:hypothetical protein BC830DRAFT_1125055 [Chytriomyces sp. MP71]
MMSHMKLEPESGLFTASSARDVSPVQMQHKHCNLVLASDGAWIHPDQHNLYEFLLEFPLRSHYIHSAPPSPSYSITSTDTIKTEPSAPHSPTRRAIRRLRVAKHPSKRSYKKRTPRALATECANCGVTQTSTWRKDADNAFVCNACGLYERMYDAKRPAELFSKGAGSRRRSLSCQL